MDADQAAALRAPFPPEQIGYITKGGTKLAFVGHAHATDRLLQVDPNWWWEPMGTDSYGLPVLDDHGNLWIRLHLLDTVTLGVGDGVSLKEKIGDAIRNAAMRRGVALDLWAKETPEWEQHETPRIKATKSKPRTPPTDEWSVPPEPPAGVEVLTPVSPPPVGALTAGQLKLINVLAAGAGITDRALLHEGISKLVGRDVDSVKKLTKSEASTVIESLQTRQPGVAS